MDVKLYYEESGAGEPLLLLHGNGESQAYFAHQKEAFSAKFRVIALDTRGHGRSPRGETPFTIGQFAEDLHTFMEEKGIASAHILGFSDGGNIALTFALRYPKRVKSLILNGANLTPGGMKPGVWLSVMCGYGLASLAAKWSLRSARKAELYGLMAKEPQIRPEELTALTMPALVIVGTHDMIRASHSRRICANLPGGRFVELEGDHFIAAKEPEAFNQAVLAFLRTV